MLNRIENRDDKKKKNWPGMAPDKVRKGCWAVEYKVRNI